MRTQISRGRGKLYRIGNEQRVDAINYQIHEDLVEEPAHWWGELTLIEYTRLKDGSGYILELEDNRKARCALKKRINRAVTSLPPRYIYYFSGTGEFE